MGGRRSLLLSLMLLIGGCAQGDAGTEPTASSPSEAVSSAAETETLEDPPCDPMGSEVTLVAVDLAFDVECISVDAGRPFAVVLVNDEPIPAERHNVSITGQDNSPIFEGDLVRGGERITYEVDALEPGDYYFVCDPHPSTMLGELYVR